jgi:NAD+ kinase
VRSLVKRIVVVTHGESSVAASALAETLAVLRDREIEVLALRTEWDKHPALLNGPPRATAISGPSELEGVDLCLVLGGDGTMLRGFHLTRDLAIPVAGVNLGRVGFLTTIPKDDVSSGLARLMAGDFVKYPLLGLEAQVEGETYRAANDVVVCKGGRPTACALGLTINGVTLFEVQCDGVVVGTPAGSSAYSLAAGGPLLGIEVDAYVISLIAAHAAGVRPVVAAPCDVLEIVNLDEGDVFLDADGLRLKPLNAGAVVRVVTCPQMTSLALLKGDSLYHHFRDRLL